LTRFIGWTPVGRAKTASRQVGPPRVVESSGNGTAPGLALTSVHVPVPYQLQWPAQTHSSSGYGPFRTRRLTPSLPLNSNAVRLTAEMR
jgi:hypothetical protein